MSSTQLGLLGLPGEIGAVGDDAEHTGANDLLVLEIAAGRQHLGVEPDHLPLLGHLALELVPEQLEVLGGREFLAAAQPVEQLLASGELGAGERLPHLTARVVRDLPHDAEHLAHLTESLGQLGFGGAEVEFVGIEGRLELVAERLLADEFGLRLGEQRLLVVARIDELLEARFVGRALLDQTRLDQVEQLEQVLGLRRRGARLVVRGAPVLGVRETAEQRRDPRQCQCLRPRLHQLFPLAGVAAGSGSSIRSGAVCLRAILSPARIEDCRLGSTGTHVLPSWLQTPAWDSSSAI